MNTHISPKKLGLLVMSASILLSIGYSLFHQQIIYLLMLYVSPDHRVTEHGAQEFTAAFYFFAILLFALGLGLLKAQNTAWRARAKQAMLGEPLSRLAPARPSPQFILVASSLSGLLLIISIRFWERFPAVFTLLYHEDGVFESLTVVALIVSVGFLGAAVWRLVKEPGISRRRGYLIAIYLLLMGLFFFDAMEEISWGQQVFGWKTPEVFAGNTQRETNLHNFFNPYFSYLYRTLALVLGVVLISAWLELKQRWLFWSRWVLPHPSLVGLGLLIAFVAIVWYREQELLEELVTVFILFYSFRIFNRFRDKSLSIEI